MPRLVALPDELDVIPLEVFLGRLEARIAARAAGVPEPEPKPEPKPYRQLYRHPEPVATVAPPSSYLVTVYCLSDNVPVGLFVSRADAEEFAHRVAGDPQPYIERFRKLTEVDPVFFKESSLLSVDITEFDGNVPASRSVIVDLDPGDIQADALSFG